MVHGQPGERLAAAQFLVQAGTPEKKAALPVLLDLLRNPQSDVRQQAATTIGLMPLEAPTAVPALAALVSDLDQRGLLGETLVLPTAEFGRTPRVNGSAGRDHWPWVYSLALAGGGVGRGVVYGASD